MSIASPSAPDPAATGSAGGPRRVRIFISSPADAQFERMRVDRVVERLNGAFADLARLETVRWEREFYKAHETFQAQIPEAADCDIVIAVLRHRLGTELPADFPHMPGGEPYPSGTAYEILTAMEAAGKKGLPDIYVFRFPEPPVVKLDDAETNALITEQWNRLKGFFARWFRTPAGHFKASYHEFRSTDEFEEQVEQLLRKWLEDKILRGRAVVWPIETKGSPFRGLSSFGARHAAVFFGRGRDIARSVDRLKEAAGRGAPFLLLVGASGSGKSSLARAGIVPRLTTPGVVTGVDLWRVASFRPGEVRGDLALGLATRLFEGIDGLGSDETGRPPALPELAAGDYPTADALAVLLGHGDETSAKPLLAALDKVAAAEQRSAGHSRTLRADLVLVIDQIDNLFTGAITAEERQRFAALLAALAATCRIWIVATLRADLYERFLKEPKLFDLKTAGATYDLQPPGPAELAEIVRGPAAAADLDFGRDPATGRTLDEVLLADADRPDMLPLLQFTLDQLFERRETVGGRPSLTFAAYAAIGGMGGAIDRQAEMAVKALGSEEQARLPRLLRQLAEPDRDGASSAPLAIRAVPLSEAAYDAPSARLVDALVEARVLLSSTEGGETHVRLAHQRVLESWERARVIVLENGAFFRIREDIEDQRRRWEAGGRRSDLLIASGLPLAEAESVARKFGAELPPGTVGFVAASTRRARARIRLLMAATFVFAVIAAVAVWQTFAAESRRREAAIERDRAEQNFAVANDAVNALARDVVQGLRFVAGVQAGTLRDILDSVRSAVNVLAATDPDSPALLKTRSVMLSEMALTYQAQGDVAAALAAARESVEVARAVSAARPGVLVEQRNVSTALNRLAGILISSGQWQEADALATESIAIIRAVAESEPSAPGYQADLQASLDLLGNVRLAEGQTDAALAAYDEMLAIGRHLVELDPADGGFRRNVLVALNRIGDIRLQLGDLDGARPLYEEGIRTARALVADDPRNTQWQRDLAVHLTNMGALVRLGGDTGASVAYYEEVVGIFRSLVAIDASNVGDRHELASSLLQLADVQLELGDAAGAIAPYEESVAIFRQDQELDPTNMEWLRDYSVALDHLGNAHYTLLALEPARAAFQEGLDIARRMEAANPDSAGAQTDLLLGLFKLAAVSGMEEREALIAEGLAILDRLEPTGLLANDPTPWREYFASVRSLPTPEEIAATRAALEAAAPPPPPAP